MASPPPGIRRSSSSLLALSNLCLPSPPITPSVSIEVSLNGTGGFGEIPIIFDFLTTSSKPAEERIQRMESLKVALPPLAKFSPISAFFPMSDSTNSLNTFGQATGLPSPTSMTFTFAKDESPIHSRRSSAFGTASSKLADVLPASTSAPTVKIVDFDSGQQKIEDMSSFTISAYLSSDSASGKGLIASTSQRSEGDMATVKLAAPRPSLEDDRTPTQSTFLHTHPKRKSIAELPYDDRTPTRSSFRSPRPESQFLTIRPMSALSSLVSSSLSLSTMEFATTSSQSKETIDDDITPTQSSFLKAQAGARQECQYSDSGANRVTAATVGVKCVLVSAANDDDETPTQSSFLNSQTPREAQPLDAQRARTAIETAMAEDMASKQDSQIQVPNLKHAKWLRDTIVELWIDQEGFRSIRPKFFLASVTNGLPHPYNGSLSTHWKTDPLFTTIAEFLPVSRVPHYFHHATLDRAPTLNRIVVDGDETRDYITRTATLALRNNGVFFVHGTEDHRPEGDNGPVVRLNWRFEYFVSNRKPDARSAHRGEKTLTPLSFSCTPALLDQARANKVKVLHIMRKTLLPKIVAQKLEPPDLLCRSPPASIGMRATRCASLISLDSESDVVYPTDVRSSPSKASLPSLKSGKNILAKATARMRRGSLSDPSPVPAIRPASSDHHSPAKQKRRRGSMDEVERKAAERQKAEVGRRLNHKRPKSLDLSKVIGKGERKTTSIAGPIIPHEELVKLLNQDPHPEIVARRASARIQTVNNERVTILPAAPRHK